MMNVVPREPSQKCLQLVAGKEVCATPRSCPRESDQLKSNLRMPVVMALPSDCQLLGAPRRD